MEIIGVSGYARAGKDTIGEILVREHGFKRVAFADKMKQIALAIDPVVAAHTSRTVGQIDLVHLVDVIDQVGWERAKENPEVRRFLQRLGTEAGRNVLGDNFWVDLAFAGLQPDAKVVITDCRFTNEAQAIVDRGGIVVRVVRPGVGPANDHASERSLDDWPFDFHVANGGTIDDLARQVASLVRVAA